MAKVFHSASAENDLLEAWLSTAADKVMAEFEHRNDVPTHMRAGQLLMLLSIRHLPVASMQAQLSG